MRAERPRKSSVGGRWRMRREGSSMGQAVYGRISRVLVWCHVRSWRHVPVLWTASENRTQPIVSHDAQVFCDHMPSVSVNETL